MNCLTCFIFVLAAWMPQDAYSLDQHASVARQCFQEATQTFTGVQEGTTSRADAARKLGQLIGRHRRYQASLAVSLQTQAPGDSAKLMKVIQLAGLVDAYLASCILSLDGDATSLEVREVTERQIARVLEGIGSTSAGDSDGELPYAAVSAAGN